MPLTDVQLRGIQPPEKPRKFFDGDGLYVEAYPNGSKLWRFRYTFNGKASRMSLGPYPEVSLKDAREHAARLRSMLRHGKNPSQDRIQEETPSETTFRSVAMRWYANEIESGTWCAKKTKTMLSQMERLIFPHIGDMPIDRVTSPDVLAACRNACAASSNYVAGIVRSTCSRIFSMAVAEGLVTTNPCFGLAKALPTHRHTPMAALTEPEDVKRLVRAIDAYHGQPATRIMLKLLSMLMCRTGELRNAEWAEIDLYENIWRITGTKMKMGRDHLVPLPRQAVVLLEELREISGTGRLLFPGRRSAEVPVSDATVLAALRYMGFSKEEMSGHGFRSMASTRLNEMGFRADVIERQLAHVDGNSVRRVYNRAEYLEERRDMLQKWADYLDSLLSDG